MAERDPRLTSTYRFQLHEGFTFTDAAEVLPHLAALGITHVYLSPVLEPVEGSMHGYDVVDHSRINPALGGTHGFEALATAAHEHGLGLVVDVVPNHMAVPTPMSRNRQLWDVLKHGQESRFARWFDIDWKLLDGKVGLPVLGAPLDNVLNDGQLALGKVDGEPVVTYFDHTFPVAPGTEGDDVREVLGRQHYVLAYWQRKAEYLTYRRFFDVDTLIAVRVELPDVFEATHRTLLDLHAAGHIDGFRIDHPDGLADPEGYLAMLAEATGGAWVVVEKILEGDERLPESWRTDGTTGYDGLAVIERALTPTTGNEVDAMWATTGGPTDLHSTEHEAKALVTRELFEPEVQRLARAAVDASVHAGRPLDHTDAEAGLRALLTHVERYRAYVRLDQPVADDQRDLLDAWARRASEHAPQAADAIGRLLPLLCGSTSDDPATRDLVVRFQQVCGPVMAKGIEDTTFYRYHRLVGLNEVGGDPSALDAPGTPPLHAWAEHQQARFPTSLVAGTTHDTKRSADARARLLAVAAHPQAWAELWDVARGLADDAGVDHPTAWMITQNFVAAWPISADRMHAYVEKAAREAKLHTTWTEPDETYERRLTELVDAGATSEALERAVSALLSTVAEDERRAVLGSTLLQLTVPGVPDVYQGTQTVSRSLVDPDNRRPVDHAGIADRLDALLHGAQPDGLADEKLRLTATVLRLRRRRPELWGAQAAYAPLDLADGLVGFTRGDAVRVLALVPGADIPDVPVDLGGNSWRDELTGRMMTGTISTARLLATAPVCLLVREDA